MYNASYHRFTIFLTACTFLLIVAGALVTSNDAGLAVPDWPTSFGNWVKIPPMVGGVKYEHGHRMVAQFVGLLTIVLAVWTQRTEGRRWMRKLAWAMLGLVIVQGVLGGLTVLMLLPWWVSTLHAMAAQTFFSLTMLMAVFASRRWLETASAGRADDGTVTLRRLSLAGVGVVYLQLFLGAAFRHQGMHFLPHVVGAVVATGVLLWLCVRALSGYGQVREIKAAAAAMLGLLFAQILLGLGAYLTRVEWGRDAAQPEMSMVVTTVAHVAVGALLLAHGFLLAVQAYRHTAPGTVAAAAKEAAA